MRWDNMKNEKSGKDNNVTTKKTNKERPKGKWKKDNTLNTSFDHDNYVCSNCGEYMSIKCIDNGWSLVSHCDYKYCPNCGAEMEAE